jgi:hypothetical protein
VAVAASLSVAEVGRPLVRSIPELLALALQEYDSLPDGFDSEQCKAAEVFPSAVEYDPP